MKTTTEFRPLRIAAFMAFVTILFTACRKTPPPTPDLGVYNLDVRLDPADAKNHFGGTGFLKFRQDPDTARIITLDTYVQGLEKHHSYLLQRAAGPLSDSTCSSTAWLTLGRLLVPQAIHTDGMGNGHELLSRDVTAIARGSQFRIHFQIIDSVTMTPVLTSDCYEYTVR